VDSQTVPVRAGLFMTDADGSPLLIGGQCSVCTRHHFPRLTMCPYCSSERVGERVLSTEGTLWGWTAVTAAPPGYLGEVPFGFGVVELPEGLRIISRLTEADPTRLTFGEAVALVLDPLHVDDEGRTIVTYAFAPVRGRS
jgi:uncharacterized OB-fold protein